MNCDKNRMIERLNEVLKHERQHFNYYLQASMEISGLERQYLKPLFEKEMAGELEHIRLFGDKIVALGGKPDTEALPFALPSSAKAILDRAVTMEREVLRVYHHFYEEAETYADLFGDLSIVLLLEENIEHTTADVEEMEKLLR
jgi:bacterioferritin (cytochrome b1)